MDRFRIPAKHLQYSYHIKHLSPYCRDRFGWTMHPATRSRIPNSIDNRVGGGRETASELDFLLVSQVAATTELMRYQKLNVMPLTAVGNREPRGSQSRRPDVRRIPGRRIHQGHSIFEYPEVPSPPSIANHYLINTETERSLKTRNILRRRKWVFPVVLRLHCRVTIW